MSSLTPLSDAMKEIAAEQGLDIVDVPCSEVEPEDLIGLPVSIPLTRKEK